MLMGQMIRGERATVHGMGASGEDGSGVGEVGDAGPEIQIMMKEQQDKLRQEYEAKVADLERERETIEEEKAQVDRYKQLLLKQRDIMIALTQRLVERDEQIMALQDELDAYDRHHKELEEKLDEKTALLIKFQRISMEVNASSPYKNEELSKALEAWSHMDSLKQSGQATEIDTRDDDGGVSGGASGASGSSGVSEGGVIGMDLTAVKEMQSLISGQRLQITQLERQLEDANSKLIISKTIGAGGGDRDVLTSISNEEKLAFESRIRQLEQQLESAPSASIAAHLQTRCSVLVKEREAMHTIMEQKIKVLVQSVASVVGAVLQSAPQSGGAAGQALTRDVAALQRLVNASIAALRNAAAANGNIPPPPLPSSSRE